MSCKNHMDGNARKDCVHGKQGEGFFECHHPKKGAWCGCDTMHMKTFDENSCQPGWYQTKEKNCMSLKGIYNPENKPVKRDEPFYLRLTKAESYYGAVSVEAVDEKGARIALICRISREKGVEMYEEVPESLGFPMSNTAVEVQGDLTC